jgi:hypothetical protein
MRGRIASAFAPSQFEEQRRQDRVFFAALFDASNSR